MNILLDIINEKIIELRKSIIIAQNEHRYTDIAVSQIRLALLEEILEEYKSKP